jgi:outer membrane protein OmpA-like peptidoglycan-associated protein
METTMNSKTAITTLLLMLMASTAFASGETERWGKAGVGAGAAAGAIVGGPPGAIIGAGLGGFLGGTMGRARTVPDLEADLEIARSDAEDLRDSLQRTRSALQAARADLSDRETRIAELERSRQATAGLETQMLFKTGSSELDVAAAERLDRLATTLRGDPDLDVRLDGHADARGETEFNLGLSEDRASAVSRALVDRGIEQGRISIHAHGAERARAEQGDLDAHAFDRRVIIRLQRDSGETSVARRD